MCAVSLSGYGLLKMRALTLNWVARVLYRSALMSRDGLVDGLAAGLNWCLGSAGI